jgi:hypothetical protein
MKSPIGLALLFFGAALAAEPLTTHERDLAMSYLHSSRKLLLDQLQGLTEAQLRFKSAPDKWSVMDVAEHVALSEEMLATNLIRNQIMASPAAPEKRTAPPNPAEDVKIATAYEDRSRKASAPEPLRASGKFANASEAVAFFKKHRDATIAWVETRPDGLRDRFLKGMEGRELDAYQWIFIVVGHTQRHVAQILEIKASAGFPAGR